MSRRVGISPGSVSFVTSFIPLSNHAVNSTAPVVALHYKSGLQAGVVDLVRNISPNIVGTMLVGWKRSKATVRRR